MEPHGPGQRCVLHRADKRIRGDGGKVVHNAVRSLGLPLEASLIHNETKVYSF